MDIAVAVVTVGLVFASAVDRGLATNFTDQTNNTILTNLTNTTNVTDSADHICFGSKSEFEYTCVQKLNGVVEGGQCFFVPGSKFIRSWEQGWDACEKEGAVVAQIHTESEYEKVYKYLKGYFLKNHLNTGQFTRILTALMDVNATKEAGNAILSNTTYWYSSRNGDDGATLVPAGLDWIRTRLSDDDEIYRIESPRCFHLVDFFRSVADNMCQTAAIALCQLTNRNQNFTRTEYCITEPPIDQISLPGPQECALACSSTPWCRSFNLIPPNSQNCNSVCQLFSWSVNDNCTACANHTASSPTCYHFNYTP